MKYSLRFSANFPLIYDTLNMHDRHTIKYISNLCHISNGAMKPDIFIRDQTTTVTEYKYMYITHPCYSRYVYEVLSCTQSKLFILFEINCISSSYYMLRINEMN